MDFNLTNRSSTFVFSDHLDRSSSCKLGISLLFYTWTLFSPSLEVFYNGDFVTNMDFIRMRSKLPEFVRRIKTWVSKCLHFLAKVIFIAFVGVILKPCKASLAVPAWTSFSNSTKAMSDFPGTSRTSRKPGNL